MNSFGIRPVHFTYVITDRRSHSFFFKNLLEMKVLRHVEVSTPSDTTCPERFVNRWCKTVFGYGPESSHFGIVLVYFYCDVSGLSNEWIGATIKSLPAIARAKAMGFPMVAVDDRSFNVTSPSGRLYNLIDEHHRSCDPLAEMHLRVKDLNASLKFWSETLRVPVISLTNKEFTLFFGNTNCRVRYVKTEEVVHRSHGHMSYTAPLSSLKVMQERCPAECLMQPLCQISYQGRDADYLMVIKDPNGFLHYFYDGQSYEKTCQFDPKAETRFDLSVNYENKFQPPFSYLDRL